jgi:subfamily B ATP-binding cassette protein MsbA
MAYAFKTLRPLFRERGKINAEVTGRLAEALGGIRSSSPHGGEARGNRLHEGPPIASSGMSRSR